MSDAFFSGMVAYQQVLMLLGGFFFLAVGGLLLGNDLYWHAKAARVAGIIAGLRRKNNVYYPVYRYQLPDGQVFETTSITGSSRIDDKPTGKMVPLLLFAEDPRDVRPAGSYAYAAGSLFFLTPGAPLVYYSLVSYPITRATWFMLGGILFFCALKIRQFESAKPRKPALQAWKAAMKATHEAEMRTLPLLRLEDIATAPSPGAKQPAAGLRETPGETTSFHEAPPGETDKKSSPADSRARAAPLFLLLGALAVTAGLLIGATVQELLLNGVAVQGKVVEMPKAAEPGKNDSAYPFISFTDKTGAPVVFRDETDRDSPSLAAGDTVDVLYLERDPEHTAMVDRGIRLWGAAVLALLVFGNGCLFVSIRLMRAVRAKK